MKPSFRARALNIWLRLTEKTHLARTKDPVKLRRSFERKARFLFRAPRGTSFEKTRLGDRPALSVKPAATVAGKTVLYFHGGAYVMGAPRTHKAMLATLCGKAGCDAVLQDYRKAPEYPFPAAVDDALAAYAELCTKRDPQDIILGGDSAGGGITLALLGEICRRGLAQPAGVFVLSPLTDVTFSGASITQNAKADTVLPAARVKDLEHLYLVGADAGDPRASPLFATFTGAAPVFLTVGDTEILRDDTLRMAAALTDAGVEVTLKLEEDLPHVWPLFHNYMPEARRTLGLVAGWINSL